MLKISWYSERLESEEEVIVNRFPDGTPRISISIDDANSLKEWPRITWIYENDDELVSLVYISRHLYDQGFKEQRLYMPYIPNARMDRIKTSEEVFTLRHFAWIINSLGFNDVVVLDPHSSVSAALFNNVRIIEPFGYVRTAIQKTRTLTDGEVPLIFYPDEGAMKRYSGRISEPYVFGVKERDWSTGKINGLSVFDCGNSIGGKNVLIVDDICSRGGTFLHSAKKLKELGAGKIFLYVTHCENTILSGELLDGSLIEQVFTTNSVFTKEHDKIEVMNVL